MKRNKFCKGRGKTHGLVSNTPFSSYFTEKGLAICRYILSS